MAIEPGTILGSYEVGALLGRGGMGEVWRASDTRLGREVAIKVLPPAVADDAERVLRFEREARLLASLNHPHIAQIYGFEEADGKRFLVLEFVDGETLAKRIARGPLSVDDALEAGHQVARALEAAHGQGIIHRDLKPANVIVKPDGTIKVLDFGLARALQPDSDVQSNDPESPTITADHTQPGVILGTAPYMSPEQARGRAVDKRSDIWSFGVLLYECLTGEMLFRGETATDSMGAIMHRDPDWSALPASTPPTAQLILRRCLAKDRRRRLHDIADARVELEEAIADPTATGLALTVSTTVKSPSSRWHAGAALGGFLLGAVVVALVMVGFMRPSPGGGSSSSVSRLTVALPPEYPFLTSFALSPDGSTLVYSAAANETAEPQLFLRRLDQFKTTTLPGTAGGQRPFFSPNGKWIGFSAKGVIRKIPLAGGAPLTICEGELFGACWGPDDAIIYGEFASGLQRVAASGGAPTSLTILDHESGEVSHGHPLMLADGDTILFTVGTGAGSRIDAVSLATGDRRILIPDGANPIHLEQDMYAYSRAGQIRVFRFDPQRPDDVGAAVPVLEGVRWQNWGGTEHARYAVAGNGCLAYAAGGTHFSPRKLFTVDFGGTTSEIAVPEGVYLHPALSPDGRRVALTRSEPGLGIGDIWTIDLERLSASRLTVVGTNYTPIWTPDGQRVTYVSNGDIVWKNADGSTPREVLLAGSAYERPLCWTADGETLIYETTISGATNIAMLHVGGKSEPLLDSPFNERTAILSPDGRWLAYSSDATGRPEVYARPFPGPGPRLMVSSKGGTEPRWSSDGAQLFYRNGRQMLAARVIQEPNFAIDAPQVLFEAAFYEQQIVWNYDVFPGGQRFMMIEQPQLPADTQIRIVLNWFEEVRPQYEQP